MLELTKVESKKKVFIAGNSVESIEQHRTYTTVITKSGNFYDVLEQAVEIEMDYRDELTPSPLSFQQ